MYKEFDIEIPKDLYSLWGSIDSSPKIIKENKNKHHIAMCVLCCAMANIYKMDEWNFHILDSIVKHAEAYFEESIKKIHTKNYEISLSDLNKYYFMNPFQINVSMEMKNFGCLYNQNRKEFNLRNALINFFNGKQTPVYGILQCMRRSISFGKTDYGYFIFDSQSKGFPLFKENQESAYILKCLTLKRLLHCIVMTLKIPYYNIEFTLHSVEIGLTKKVQLESQEMSFEAADNLIENNVDVEENMKENIV